MKISDNSELTKKRLLLFYGELPSNSLHGIAISSLINLKMLESSFQLDLVEEKNKLTEHNKISFSKLWNVLRNNLIILTKSIRHKYGYFYLIFSLSTFGSLKTLSAIILFRIFNRGHVVLHLHRGDFFLRFYKKKINRIIAKLVFLFSKNIIVLSENQRSEFESVFKRPFLVLCNTVETEYVATTEKRQNCRFIYISNYLKDKGIIDLLEVFRKLTDQYPKITLRTYGEFSDMDLKETILRFRSSDICINGPISGIDKYKELANSDCLILPSWNEGQPMILLEAMSVGTPIISTRVGMIPELLGVDYPYLSIPHDKNSLENCIVNYINQTDTEGISEILKSRFNSFYSHKIHEKCLLTIFR
jgi:glycosyltransferase involved in cell wall biosynthesis